MKNLTLIFTLLTTLTLQAAGDRGNGGGAWVCQNEDQLKSIRWIRLVDLYEAEKEFHLPIRNFGTRDYTEIVDTQKVRLFSISKDLYEKFADYFDEVDSKIRQVDVDLEIIDDSLYRVRPPVRECPGGKIKYAQVANFTHYGAVLINQYFFNHEKFAEVDKAALIFHEAIYTYLREKHDDQNSTRARKIVGLLFSQLANNDIEEEINEILGTASHNIRGMTFVTIPAGDLWMGSPRGEAGRGSNEAQRYVRLTHDFEMMTTPVTQLMYFEVTGENPSRFKNQADCPNTFTSATSHVTRKIVTLCPHNPVERVSYHDVESFIDLLNAKTGMNYRFPTEAEWEYAARAGSSSAYSFGNNAAHLSKYAIHRGNSGNKTHPVGSLRSYANLPNAFGLYDMHGNVWEWVQDWYTESPAGGENPKGPANGSLRVIRGGGWYSNAQNLRSANRNTHSPPSYMYNSVGFRLVRTLP